MGIWYVKEVERAEELFTKQRAKWIQGLIWWWKKRFCSITVREVGTRIIAFLPYQKGMNLSQKQWEKLARRLDDCLYDKANQNLALSMELTRKKEFVNFLNAHQCRVLDGRWLFAHMIDEVLDYITEKSQRQLETLELSMMVNDNSEKNLKTIVRLAQKVKMLNIVTNHIESFKKIEEYLYEKLGILIRITNNTKKALLKTNVVLNMDFPEEILNRYVLPKKAIVINLEEAVTIRSKRFEGINVNFFEVELPESERAFFEKNHLLNGFHSSVLYESILFGRASYDSVRKQIEENKSNVKNLIGVSGIISEKEFKQLQ